MIDKNISRETLLKAADEFGTPLYVYDKTRIEEQYERLKKAFEGQHVRFFYACKALTNIHILKLIASLGVSVDCSSINEVKVARFAGIPPERILYTSNSISFEEIENAVEEGVFVHIDSLSNLEKFGKKFGSDYPAGIRLRPNIMAGGNIKIATGHDKSKFGIPINQMQEILDIIDRYGIKVRTLHIHTGSGIGDISVFMKAVGVLLDATEKFPDVKILDLGGGFKVPYREDEKGVDVEELAISIHQAVKEAEEKQKRKFELWFEPGKFLVSRAGYLLARANVIEKTSTITFAGIDTGFNHLIRPMFYGAYHRIENLTRPAGNKKEYTVVGNLCETDTFASDRMIAEIEEGDILLIYNAGAYGFEMASSFNSRCRPAEVLIENEKMQLIRKRETVDDLLRNQIFADL